MAKGWDTHVYRTDEQPEKYVGFFENDKSAETWIDKQKEGSYEVSQDKPRDRVASASVPGGSSE